MSPLVLDVVAFTTMIALSVAIIGGLGAALVGCIVLLALQLKRWSR